MPRERSSLPLGPLDLSVSGAEAPDGTLEKVEGLVWQGSGNPSLSPAAAPAELPVGGGGSEKILAIHPQIRDRHGRFSADDTSSLSRLVVLHPDRLSVYDPESWGEKVAYSFDAIDYDRQAQFASIGDRLIISFADGPGVGAPGQVLVLRDDVALPLAPPDLPYVSAGTDTTAGQAEAGVYSFRCAWELKGGTLGPASRPYTVELGSPGTITFTIGSYPREAPSADYSKLLRGVRVFLYKATSGGAAEDASTIRELAGAAYAEAALIEGTASGAQAEWDQPAAELAEGELLETGSLAQHEIRAGAAYSYNGRLLLGDVAYDFRRPAAANSLRGYAGSGGGGANEPPITTTSPGDTFVDPGTTKDYTVEAQDPDSPQDIDRFEVELSGATSAVSSDPIEYYNGSSWITGDPSSTDAARWRQVLHITNDGSASRRVTIKGEAEDARGGVGSVCKEVYLQPSQ